jgi:geranylgeranyl diphosphate synthase, type II
MNELMESNKKMVEARILRLLDLPGINETLRSAMQYSVMAGGKRIRPNLNIMANSLLGGNTQETLDIACAIELIHTYSLIHDDLPAMDNDELRRGKPTSHVMFGEAMAILAGDALLNFGFEVMIANAQRYPANLAAHLRAMQAVAQGAGALGMVTGQCGDLENEGQILTERELYFVHEKKTGAIIEASLMSGLLLCNPDEKQLEALRTYGQNIGLTFQITDDVLDITGNVADIGKSIGKDKAAKKFTFPTLYGVEKSLKIAAEKTIEATQALSVFGSKADPLRDLAMMILKRNN